MSRKDLLRFLSKPAKYVHSGWPQRHWIITPENISDAKFVQLQAQITSLHNHIQRLSTLLDQRKFPCLLDPVLPQGIGLCQSEEQTDSQDSLVQGLFHSAFCSTSITTPHVIR